MSIRKIRIISVLFFNGSAMFTYYYFYAIKKLFLSVSIRQIRVICVLFFNGNAKNFSFFDFINNSVMINVL